MKKIFPTHSRTLEVLIHIISWTIVLSFPILIADRTEEGMDWHRYVRHSIVPFSFMFLFYLNYFLLIPKYLFKEQTYKYILYNLLLMIFCGLFLQMWQSMVLPPPPPLESFASSKRPPRKYLFFIRDLISMAFTVSLSAIVRISLRWNQIETARQEAEKSKTEAELKNLRNQLNPHFLLNTLNNIYALIAFDTDKAQQAVQELSKLLRHMLYDNQLNFVPLNKEVDFICNYIALMRIRISPNVELSTNIRINKESRTPIAPLLFISLIENAFKHGISPTEPSYIHITLSEEEETITCEIINSNFPKSSQDKSGSGIGLAQVNKRLELLYPGQHTWKKGVRNNEKEYMSHLRINTQNL